MFHADAIKAKLLEQPFVPMRIITNSGQAFDIPSRIWLWWARIA